MQGHTSTASPEVHPGKRAFDAAVIDARIVLDYRRWKAAASTPDSFPARCLSLTPGQCEARARKAEKRVREIAIRAEITLARDLRRGQVAA